MTSLPAQRSPTTYETFKHSKHDDVVCRQAQVPARKMLMMEHVKEPLDLYLPVGCLRCAATEESKPVAGNEHDQWIEVTSTHEVCTDVRIQSHLIRLINCGWVRCFRLSSQSSTGIQIFRIYVLPSDVARITIDRDSKTLKKSLDEIFLCLDVSPHTWSGNAQIKSENFDMFATADNSSLFYLFNTIPSPSPNPDLVGNRYSRAAMRSILNENEPVRGLKTFLYPYQKRSAATMLQREVAPQMQLDPRFDPRTTPTGETYFWNARDRIINKYPLFYDSVRGGILAETMGLGKTLICLALVLATKGHWPSVPPQHSLSRVPVRNKVGSLQEMCAATISRYPIPWRQSFESIEQNDGDSMDECVKMLEKNPSTFTVEPRIIREQRSHVVSKPGKQYRLCNCTIIVVPRNLMHQWTSELSKHVDSGALKVLFLGDSKVALPPAEEIAAYDVLLFSRPRFEQENRSDSMAMQANDSVLKQLRFLRIIIDEGHSMSNTNTNAAIVAGKIIDAERRWVVSGTPARDLMGIEVDVNAMAIEHMSDNPADFGQDLLKERKSFSYAQEKSSGAIKSLGTLTSHFLKAQPWSHNSVEGIVDVANWDEQIYRHEDLRNRTYSCFSSCLRRVLENLVVKTQPEDVARDMQLPPLTHEVIRLEPSFCDKLTANLFILVFTTNAVTSERTDIDYLFHRNSQRHLHQLISNLRQSAFFWTAINEEAVLKSLETSAKYLAKDGINCSDEDRLLLAETARATQTALSSPVWKALSQTHEMGLFVDSWPKKFESAWAFQDCQDPVCIGLESLSKSQRFLNSKLSDENPLRGFAAAGACATNETLDEALVEGNDVSKAPVMVKAGVPSSSIATDPMGSRRISVSGTSRGSPKRSRIGSIGESDIRIGTKHSKSADSARRKLWSGNDSNVVLDHETSELGRARITGTTSAKFSYLMDRIWELHETEKILIFYSGGNIAYCLAQGLDVLHVKYLIYANTLSGEQRSKYIVLFDTDPTQRVLLMDIKQAAHGLNLSSASRVFFVNPVCRPDVEAQAIKRAHRIGQTKPVHVETLVLKGTTDEAMHERAAKMTRHEHLQAKTLEDDSTITKIIQDAKVLTLTEDERQGRGQMAPLRHMQQIFGRPGREKTKTNLSILEKEIFGEDGVVSLSSSRKRKSQPNASTLENEQAEKRLRSFSPPLGPNASVSAAPAYSSPGSGNLHDPFYSSVASSSLSSSSLSLSSSQKIFSSTSASLSSSSRSEQQGRDENYQSLFGG